MNKKLFITNIDSNFRENCDVIWFNDFIFNVINKLNFKYHNFDDTTDNFIIKYNKYPDIILIYENINLNNLELFNKLKQFGTKILLITEDLHLYNEEHAKILYNMSNIILSRFNLIHKIYKWTNNIKIIDYPLYCGNKFLTDNINYNSINKISMYGNINTDQYYYRHEWYNFFITNFKNNFLYFKLNSDELIIELKKYTFGFVTGYCPKIFEKNIEEHYFVGKFFEVCGLGQVLLVEKKYVLNFLNKYGFVENIHYLDVGNKNYKRINEILDINKTKLDYIRNNAFNLIKKNHMIQNRIEELYNIII